MAEPVQFVKTPYVCGPLTELPPETQSIVKNFYERIGDLCGELFGQRAFVPHEHYDPIKHASFTPPEVDRAERHQVCELTNLLIVVAIAPSWGGGIEVEMAHRSKAPILVLIPKGKKVSRLLRGNPSLARELEFEDYDQALSMLRHSLPDIIRPLPAIPSLLPCS